MTRRSAVVICPGRGTYNAAELGYLARNHADKPEFIEMIDNIRREQGQVLISELDNADRFSPSKHGSGDNASLLIYACAMADFMAIDRDKYEIVGVTGNSMGWYLSLAAGGALSLEQGGRLVNTTGAIMTEHGVGGQIVFSVLDDDWRTDPGKANALDAVLQAASEKPGIFLSVSIYLGGMVVLAADDAGLKFLMENLPKDDRFPFQIRGHSAFHSSLLSHCAEMAVDQYPAYHFKGPDIPLIDGLGNVWMPHASDAAELCAYTLGRQITETYNFSKAVEVAAKEFAPDVFIVLGPGTTMGAPAAQTLIKANWQKLDGKASFKSRQDADPIVLSMGIPEQRQHVIKG